MIQSLGYILIYKKIEDWEWWDSPLMVKSWLHILLSANYETKSWMGKTVERGSFITSYSKLSRELNVSIKSVRTILTRLEKCGQISVLRAQRFTKVTICNYDSYQQRKRNKRAQSSIQESIQEGTNESTQKGTNESTQKGTNESATTKEIKEINKENNNNNNTTTTTWEIPKLVSVESIFEILENSENSWKEIAAMKIGCKISDLSEMFRMFQSELIAQGLKEKKENEIKRHFINMMRAIKNKNHGNGTNKTSGGANRYGILGKTINSAAENGERVENIIQLASELAKCD